jgi:hypothetical protein
MAAPQEPAKTPPDPEQRKSKRPWNWILITALAAVLVIAGAILGAAELASSHSSDSSSQEPVKAPSIVNNTNENSNGNKQSQTQGSGGSSSQSQATVVPVGQPYNQGGQKQQRVKIIINNNTTIGIRIFHGGGWYISTGPNSYIGTTPPPYMGSTGSSGASGSSGSSYLSLSALEKSMSIAQTNALAGASSSDFNYTGTGSVTVQVTCIQAGAGPAVHTYSCWATDGVGDNGESDTVTVTGNSWTDTGMTWTGPNVPSGSYTTPAETASTGSSGSSGASGSSGSSAAGGSSGSSSSGSSYLSLSALEKSMSIAQTNALAGASSSDFNYTGTGSVTVQVTCIQAGAGPAVHTYSCWATDGVGDNGESDTVTVTGNSWTDTGMTWTGPNVPSGSYTTPAETASGTTSLSTPSSPSSSPSASPSPSPSSSPSSGSGSVGPNLDVSAIETALAKAQEADLAAARHRSLITPSHCRCLPLEYKLALAAWVTLHLVLRDSCSHARQEMG